MKLFVRGASRTWCHSHARTHAHTYASAHAHACARFLPATRTCFAQARAIPILELLQWRKTQVVADVDELRLASTKADDTEEQLEIRQQRARPREQQQGVRQQEANHEELGGERSWAGKEQR